MLKSSREGETESAENVSDAWCDYEKVKGLCLLAPTMDELAWSLGISRTTLWRRMKEDAVLATIIEQTSTHGRKLSLKRMQWQSAAKGDRALLIWLGKQELGQREPDKAIQGDAIGAEYSIEQVQAGALDAIGERIQQAIDAGESLEQVLAVVEDNKRRLKPAEQIPGESAGESSSQAPQVPVDTGA